MKMRVLAAVAALVGVMTLAAGAASAAPTPPHRESAVEADAPDARAEQVEAAIQEAERIEEELRTVADEHGVSPERLIVECQGGVLVAYHSNYPTVPLWMSPTIYCVVTDLIDWLF
ncbi:hypothetical protein ACE2AJ_17180 [Aquihabitans daechungensis]|uniref:hypothetical protein n=1 Tax=Aquihabitans daechungensis TaxID=1052257 RepID=UPI003BA34D30